MTPRKASPADGGRRLTLTSCPICGDPLETVVDGQKCPGCGQPARTRSLGPVMEEVVWPAIDQTLAARAPMLAFAPVKAELKLIDHGIALTSVSLYGSYGSDHQEGVDVRDLHQFESGSCLRRLLDPPVRLLRRARAGPERAGSRDRAGGDVLHAAQRHPHAGGPRTAPIEARARGPVRLLRVPARGPWVAGHQGGQRLAARGNWAIRLRPDPRQRRGRAFRRGQRVVHRPPQGKHERRPARVRQMAEVGRQGHLATPAIAAVAVSARRGGSAAAGADGDRSLGGGVGPLGARRSRLRLLASGGSPDPPGGRPDRALRGARLGRGQPRGHGHGHRSLLGRRRGLDGQRL